MFFDEEWKEWFILFLIPTYSFRRKNKFITSFAVQTFVWRLILIIFIYQVATFNNTSSSYRQIFLILLFITVSFPTYIKKYLRNRK